MITSISTEKLLREYILLVTHLVELMGCRILINKQIIIKPRPILQLLSAQLGWI
jgi:hypothetical protein